MKKLIYSFVLLSFSLWHSVGNAYEAYNSAHPSSPLNYIKSSSHGMQIKPGSSWGWLTYDVICMNDVKSSFKSDIMDATIELPEYTNYSNGSEIFWGVHSYAELEELNYVIGQPFCKSKGNH